MRKKLAFIVALCLLNFEVVAQIINTYAGIGTAGFSGDGGPASAAQFNRPTGICFDPIGNMYVSDLNNNRVRKINTSGIISTIAGNGTSRYIGDSGPATAASFTGPAGLAIDRTGNLYVMDADSPAIRKISASGIITTVAGNGLQGYSGDGGPATAARLRGASSILVDNSGNLIFTDDGNHCVRKITTDGRITTIAGTGVLGFSGDGGPATAATFHTAHAVALDSRGDLYVADYNNLRIRRVDSGGTITTIAGTGVNMSTGDGGPATAATIGNVYNLLIDNDVLYFSDGNQGKIRRIDLVSGIVNLVAGDGTHCGYGGDGGPAVAAQLCGPHSMIFDSRKNFFFTDLLNHRVRFLKSTVDVQNANTPKSEFLITPNPSISGVFTLKLSNDIDQSSHVVITNAIGVKVKELDCPTNQETELQLNAPPGLYLVTVTTEHGSWSGRVVVER